MAFFFTYLQNIKTQVRIIKTSSNAKQSLKQLSLLTLLKLQKKNKEVNSMMTKEEF